MHALRALGSTLRGNCSKAQRRLLHLHTAATYNFVLPMLYRPCCPTAPGVCCAAAASTWRAAWQRPALQGCPASSHSTWSRSRQQHLQHRAAQAAAVVAWWGRPTALHSSQVPRGCLLMWGLPTSVLSSVRPHKVRRGGSFPHDAGLKGVGYVFIFILILIWKWHVTYFRQIPLMWGLLTSALNLCEAAQSGYQGYIQCWHERERERGNTPVCNHLAPQTCHPHRLRHHWR